MTIEIHRVMQQADNFHRALGGNPKHHKVAWMLHLPEIGGGAPAAEAQVIAEKAG